jgi:formylglycine-generating enzyme required for sulfatase activity
MKTFYTVLLCVAAWFGYVVLAQVTVENLNVAFPVAGGQVTVTTFKNVPNQPGQYQIVWSYEGLEPTTLVSLYFEADGRRSPIAGAQNIEVSLGVPNPEAKKGIIVWEPIGDIAGAISLFVEEAGRVETPPPTSEYPILEPGQSLKATEPVYALFKPKVNGTYIFETKGEGNTDTFINVYKGRSIDAVGEPLAFDNDRGSGFFDAMVEVELEANEIYLIEVIYFEDSSGLFELSAEQKVFVTRNADWQKFVYEVFDSTRMVLVPAGHFTIGNNSTGVDYAWQYCSEIKVDGDCDRTWFEDELNGETQNFSEAFWIDETEVTRSAYEACVTAKVCEPVVANQFSNTPDQAVNNVTWYQAAGYCNWRNARLPTEAEWEYAARGPDGLRFPWGNGIVGDEANHCDVNCVNAPWFSEEASYINPEHNDGHAGIAPVGSYPKGVSWIGALDMAGNVSEWTGTRYERYPFSNDNRNLLADENPINGDVSRRGGGFNLGSNFLRPANRDHSVPEAVYVGGGFRCVRTYSDF